MPPIQSAVQTAADVLQQISERHPGERGRRAAAVALVLRVVEVVVAGGAVGEFQLRRARREVEEVQGKVERAVLTRVLRLVEAGGEGMPEGLAGALLDTAYELETTRRLAEADAVLALACSLQEARADLWLHAARVARLQGDRERALALYRRAQEADADDGAIARLAAVGAAVVSPAAERALGCVLRAAVRAGDEEAAAVALEERSRVRREQGDREGAVRDLCIAAARFRDPVDRARAAHRVADVCTAGDDLLGAREALLVALAWGDATQKDHARSRLHTVARGLGDQVGMRRWRSTTRPALVSLAGRQHPRADRSSAPMLARWRARAEAAR